MFRILSEEEKNKFAPELIGDNSKLLIFDGLKYWIVKPRKVSQDEEKRDLLGFLLGYTFANIAEVKILNENELEDIKKLLNLPAELGITNTYLIRLCGSYNIEELPNKSLEKAVATELVYSTWIRRRDTHVENRVYLSGGIPIFYDHHVAFLGEDPSVKDVDSFFLDRPGHAHGNARYWRVIETNEIITTSKARGVTSVREKVYHYVNDINAFKKEIERAHISLIEKYSKVDLENIVAGAGFDSIQQNSIVSFLKGGISTLEKDLEKTKEVIFSTVYT